MYERIWMNGNFAGIPEVRNTVNPEKDAVYEGINFYETQKGPVLFRLHDHLKRFARSSEMSGFVVAYKKDELAESMAALVLESGLRRGYVRLEAWDCDGEKAHVVASANDVDNYYDVLFGINSENDGIGALLVEEDLRPELKESAQLKGTKGLSHTGNGRRLAHRFGYHTALLYTPDGRIIEGSEGNIFFSREGMLYVIPEREPYLDGITQNTLLWLVPDVEEAQLKADDLSHIDEIILTGTAIGIVPVADIKSLKITQTAHDRSETGCPVISDSGFQNPGIREWAIALQDAYRKCVIGKTDVPESWLTYVNV